MQNCNPFEESTNFPLVLYWYSAGDRVEIEDNDSRGGSHSRERMRKETTSA